MDDLDNKEGVTCLFFEEQTVGSFIDAVQGFEVKEFNPAQIRNNAMLFSRETFNEKI